MKKWLGVIILIILAALVTWGLLNLSEIINAIQGRYTAWKTQPGLDLGGKTPEETFTMFVSALKNSDIDLASRYFVLSEQESWRKTLEEYRKNNLLADFVAELERSKSDLKFQKDTNGVWKIDSL